LAARHALALAQPRIGIMSCSDDPRFSATSVLPFVNDLAHRMHFSNIVNRIR
jgi:hypothetical protein